MSTISVPIDARLEEFIDGMIKQGKASNKADVVRKALRELELQDALSAIAEAEADYKAGRIYKGNLREILRKIK